MTEHKQGGDGVEELHGKILAWQRWLTFFGATLIISYVSYFGLILGQIPAIDSDKWGAFGDFFGGILNPIVAFAAFYWLTQSVKLQKQELFETRLELKKSADAQSLLVDSGRDSVRLAALTALANYANARLDNIDRNIAFYTNEAAKFTEIFDKNQAMQKFEMTKNAKIYAGLRDDVAAEAEKWSRRIRDILEEQEERSSIEELNRRSKVNQAEAE